MKCSLSLRILGLRLTEKTDFKCSHEGEPMYIRDDIPISSAKPQHSTSVVYGNIIRCMITLWISICALCNIR